MPLKIFAVGDIMLGEQPLCNNFGVASVIEEKGVDFLFDNVRSIFADGDIVFGNLECPIAVEKNADREERTFFCASPDAVKGLKRAHFNILSVANNHIMEHEGLVFQNTVRLLRENGIHPVGVVREIELLTIRGHKVAFLAYSFIEDAFSNPQYNKIRDEEPIIRDIQKTRPLVDLIIISLHWGHEYVPSPSPNQVRIGRKLVDAGADVILGGHPHVTQSYEIYRNKPIIYSLGNFIFDHAYIPSTRESFISQIVFDDSLKFLSIDIIPIAMNGTDYRPEIIISSQSDSLLASVRRVNILLQGHSLSEYRDSIGDYGLQIQKNQRAAKWKMKVQFIRNIHRYSISTTLGMMKGLLKK